MTVARKDEGMAESRGSAKTRFEAPFVRSDSGVLRGVLVVAPSAAIERERPVAGESNAIAERAEAQHEIFVGRLKAHGVKVVQLEPDPGAPLASLCSDTAIVFPDGAFVLRPSDLSRRSELTAIEVALERLGIPIVGRIGAPGLLDGGDVLFSGETVYIGITQPRQSEVGIPRGIHGNAHGREQLSAYAKARGWKVVEVPLAAEARRLRAVASLIGSDTVLAAAGLLDVAAFDGLRVLEVPRGEDYAAGALVLGGRSLIENLRFRETLPMLRRAKLAVDAIDLWEFGKIGATPSSLVLALKRA